MVSTKGGVQNATSNLTSIHDNRVVDNRGPVKQCIGNKELAKGEWKVFIRSGLNKVTTDVLNLLILFAFLNIHIKQLSGLFELHYIKYGH